MIMHTVGEVHPSFHLFPSSSYLGQELACNGTEHSFSQCGYSPPTSPECFVGNHSAAVVCRQGTRVQHVANIDCMISNTITTPLTLICLLC